MIDPFSEIVPLWKHSGEENNSGNIGFFVS